jgi:protocatechuate 3,4-dioxygenase beta subunit
VLEALLHVAIYAGVPRANHAIKIAKGGLRPDEGRRRKAMSSSAPLPGEYFQRDREMHPPAFTPGCKTSVARAPRNALLSLEQPLSEITGPTFGHSDLGPLDNDPIRNVATTGDPIGERIIVHGRALDENGRPVPNTLVEIWLANAGGRYRHKKDTYLAPLKDVLLEVRRADANGIHPHAEDPRFDRVARGFRGWGRVITNFDTGLWGFDTIKPGPVPGRQGRTRAPHLNLWIVARGINIGLNTRMYFPEDAALHAADPLLGLIEQRHRMATLIAQKAGPGAYRSDIRPQADNETVFLDIRGHVPALHHPRRHHRVPAHQGQQPGGADHHRRTGGVDARGI